MIPSNEYRLIEAVCDALDHASGHFSRVFPATPNPFQGAVQQLVMHRHAMHQQAVHDMFYLSDPRTNQAWAIYNAQNELRKELGIAQLANITTVPHYNADDKKDFVTLESAELWVKYNHRNLPPEILFTLGALHIKLFTGRYKGAEIWSQTTLPGYQWERQAPHDWGHVPLNQEMFQAWLTGQLLINKHNSLITPPSETEDIAAVIAQKREWLMDAVQVIYASDEWVQFAAEDHREQGQVHGDKRQFRIYRHELVIGKEKRVYVDGKFTEIMDKSPPESTVKGLLEVIEEEQFVDKICSYLNFDVSRLVIPSWSSNVQS